MENAKISIVIPVYNTPRNLLSRCINSLVHQTLDGIELIFVDDASTDDTLSYLREKEREYKQIKVISHKNNKRQGGARNTGIRAATADLIGFCDSDDFVELDMYEKLYNKIKECPNYDCVRCFSDRFNDTKGFYKVQENTRSELVRLGGVENLSISEHEFFIISGGGVFCYLVKRFLFFKYNLWFPEHVYFEDNFLWPILKMYVNRFGIVDEDLYHYCENVDSTTGSMNSLKIQDRIFVEDQKIVEFKKRNLFSKYNKAIEFIFWILAYRNTVYWAAGSFDRKEAECIYRQQKDKMNKHFPNYKKNKYIQATIGKGIKAKINNIVLDYFFYIHLYLYKVKQLVILKFNN